VRSADARAGETVLDFGYGTGILLPTWAGRGAAVWATDLHLEIARSVCARFRLDGAVRFVETGEWDAEIPDGSLHVIVAANVLEHVDHRPALYAAFRRKLAPGGRLVVSGPTENALYRLGRRLIGFTGDYHVTTIADLFAELDASGFRRVRETRYPLPGPACLYRIARYE
jgi:2-polyprenyl-3-methyl-5-hydroxy-6-metoxy-1,4-benzoquinol methylase